jgi:Tfp pilus assembly protein PilF
LANNYFRLDRIDEATSLYLRALYIDPGNAVIHSRLGTAYWKNGFIRKAIMEFETALRIDPGLTKTRDYLDHIYRGLEAEGRAIE